MKSANLPMAITGGLRRTDEIAFLPAALEIVEAPPSPIGRALSLTLMAAFAAALAWASLGEVDIVASAQGRIVPSGRTKTVQPLEIGVVRAIRVQDGEAVKAGDVLIELDSTVSNADRDRLKTDLAASRLDVARLKASLLPDPVAGFDPPSDTDPALLATQRRLLANMASEHAAKIAALDHQKLQKEAERDSQGATVAKIEATIPLLQQKVDIRKYLVDREYGSKLTYIENMTDLVSHQKELGIAQSRQREASAAAAAIAQTREQTIAEYRRTRLGELATAEQKTAGLTQDLIKAEERSRLQVITAPVDGTVQQLAVHTVGGVVTPAQALMEIVPRDNRLEIEAQVSNRDVGFVLPGQEAEIKVDTFNFTKYGLLKGSVVTVSADAVAQDRGQTGLTDNRRGAPRGEDAGYAARVALDRSQMEVDGRIVDLSAGMAVTVEIKTGTRRIISYLLSPLVRFKQETLRER